MFPAVADCVSKRCARRSSNSRSTKTCWGLTSPSTIPTKIPTSAVQKNSSTFWRRFSPRACKPRKHRRQKLRAPPKFPLPDQPLNLSCKEKFGPFSNAHFKAGLGSGLRNGSSSLRALARMTRQPEKRQVQTRGRHILFHFFRRQVFADFRAHRGYEATHGLRIAPGLLKDSLGRFHPAVQPLPELRDVRGGVFGESKMRQEQTLWLALQNPGEGGIPERQVDIRRGRGRHHVRVPFDAYPRRVAHEGDALDVLEIADVVRGVARRVGHLDFA